MKKIYVTTIIFFSFFVCQATNYYLSNTGNDTLAGTSPATAWRTIAKLDSVIYAAGDSVYFKRGNKFIGTVTVHQSGTASSPIVFTAYGVGAKPIITGAVPITNWTATGNMFRDSIAQPIRNFFVNNQEMPLARFPNTGFLSLDSANGMNGLFDSNLNQPTGYWDSARVCVHTAQWSWEKTIVSTYTTGELDYSVPLQLTAPNGYGYFLYDKFSELDTAREWFNDTTQHLIYFMPQAGQDPNLQMCEATLFNTGIVLLHNVSNIVILELYFDKQFEAGVKMNDSTCNHVFVGLCDFFGQYNYGVEIKGKYNSVSNCSFSEVDGHGVDISNGGNVEIHHNTFRKIGQYRNSGIGGQTNFTAIAANFSDSCYIHHNNIDSTGYCGISSAGTNHLVERNIISDAMLLVNDGAPLKIFGAGSHNSVFRNNIISASNGNTAGTLNANFKTPGIYFDFGVNNCVVKSNTIYNQRHKGIFLNGSSNTNLVSENVVYGTEILIDMNGASNVLPIHDYNITHNVFFALDTGATIMRQTDQAGTFAFGLIDSNYYFNPYNDAKIALRIIDTTPSFYTLQNWQLQSGNDLNTKGSFVHWSLPTNNSQLFINPSDSVFTINLGAAQYLDLDSNVICGDISLDPYTSRVLINTQTSCDVGIQHIVESGFSIYPNPVSQLLNVHYDSQGAEENSAMRMFDLTGQEILFQKINKGKMEISIDVSDLKPGIYFLQIDSETKKIVKM